jgi:26S proteasome regulatory subunit N6
MILDKILDGVLDQGRGCLLLFDQADDDEGYADAIKMIDEVGKVVESLYGKVRIPDSLGYRDLTWRQAMTIA